MEILKNKFLKIYEEENSMKNLILTDKLSIPIMKYLNFEMDQFEKIIDEISSNFDKNFEENKVIIEFVTFRDIEKFVNEGKNDEFIKMENLRENNRDYIGITIEQFDENNYIIVFFWVRRGNWIILVKQGKNAKIKSKIIKK